MEHPGQHDPPPEAGDLVQDVCREPWSLGVSGAGGCVLIPGSGVTSRLRVPASALDLSSHKTRSGNALSSELRIPLWGS